MRLFFEIKIWACFWPKGLRASIDDRSTLGYSVSKVNKVYTFYMVLGFMELYVDVNDSLTYFG